MNYPTFDEQYHAMVKNVMTNGKEYLTRARDPITGQQLKAKKLFRQSFVFDLEEHFPILTTKKMPVSKTHPENGLLLASELIWIYVMGSNNVQDLRDMGNTTWDEWEIKEGKWAGSIGPAYGWQARRHTTTEGVDEEGYVKKRRIDQVANLIEGLKKDPQGRRHIITFWSVPHLDAMGLPPCAFMTVWDVDGDRLNCQLIQRSGDLGLGVPFNVTQYAMLVHMVAQAVGLRPGIFAHEITNAHVYENHYAPLEKQMQREPQAPVAHLWLNPDVTDFNDFTVADIQVRDYAPLAGIKMPVGV